MTNVTTSKSVFSHLVVTQVHLTRALRVLDDANATRLVATQVHLGWGLDDKTDDH